MDGISHTISASAERLADKLNKEIDKGNNTGPFLIALLIAGFKDFLDIILNFMLVGEIPGVNFGTGLFLTSFLFFFMLSKGYFLKTRIKIWFWVLGLFVDGLPLISTLPMNVMLVLYAWRLAVKRKHKAEQKLLELHVMSEQEISAYENDISLLESNREEPIPMGARPRGKEERRDRGTKRYGLANNFSYRETRAQNKQKRDNQNKEAA